MKRSDHLLLNKVHYPVEVLGFGSRIGIWTQGCTIECEGCISMDTWAADHSSAVPVEAVLTMVKERLDEGLDGLTISGGEPFDQPEALAMLLSGLAEWRNQTGREFDLLAYSGRNRHYLERHHAGILDYLDAVVAGPFVAGLPASNGWAGSSNQELVLITDLGRERYSELRDSGKPKSLQVAVDSEDIWFIGIPEPGDMDLVLEALEARGIDPGSPTWRP